jgi:hypothetical protein
MQSLALEHATALSWLCTALDGLGTVWALQLVPFQRSATGTLLPPAMPLPTAVQSLAELHETPFSATSKVLAGLGTLWTVQLEPFQRSANGCDGKSVVPAPPTAVHAVDDVHETARKAADAVPGGAGTFLTLQLLPFHTSERACPSPSGLM